MARLIYLIGASGCGKDSLLTALAPQASARQLLIAHRYITRPASSGGENHIALSKHDFLYRQQRGLFCLSWQAHQLYYGVGIEIDLWLEKGLSVIVNGSRAYLPQAEARYGPSLLPLCLTVPADILRQRLQQRGRENAEQIQERLQRADDYQSVLPPTCVRLPNSGPLDNTVRMFWDWMASTAVK
ncbi:ribose 1,5-bisphosphokinase [Samsonia erythrinae]|uniref:Ribose 1,5-bisphosphate phosphokinase PhnN n=1 Tax=Samsonia erythrinae TaxID=160434 RepID=A0A4R3VNM0_9GAMM|nr:ribose 1,5-bisphosphokinase [Samsonia erythrinae]TCV08605.1 ribose 1,5-bisphosphokinase [Samsonia erythrinae]